MSLCSRLQVSDAESVVEITENHVVLVLTFHGCADVLGVVQSVGPLTTVNRKSNNEEIPKRDVVLVDQRFVVAELH